MHPALCGSIINSRRGLLAFCWSIVTLLSAIAFVTALIFATAATNDDDQNDDGNDDRNGVISSRAMVFAALWTAVLSVGMSILGTVVLGWQSPTGQYYVCCPGKVHRTSSLSLGTFLGALLMYANVTLICSVIFSEFQVRDYARGDDGKQQQKGNRTMEQSSIAFSMMCLFLTILYAGFAALVFLFHDAVITETLADIREEALQPSNEIGVNLHPSGGYVGGAFDGARHSGYISTSSNNPGTMA